MEIDRRTFVAAAGALACAMCGCAGDANTVGPQAKGGEGPNLDVGTLADYPHDGATDRFAKKSEVIVIRRGDRIFAISAACTHRNCIVRNSGTNLRCPCHGSRFDYDGNVTRGPAKRPLIHFGIANDNGRLIVDKSQSYNDLSDSGSYVSVRAQPTTGATS